MPKIYLYAEILTHLRQLTLHASLQTEKNEETKIDVSSDKKIITVVHDGESSSLYLPTQISGTAKVTFPLDKKTELSARVQIDDLEQWKEADAAGIESPWNASELSSATSMSCTKCDYEIVPTGSISSWKDLPNQNWADVMDLWFCHKPHEHHGESHETKAAESKGFSAQSRLVSESGVGLVDIVSFALHPDDCKTTKITRSENENTLKPIPINCPKCNFHLGVFSVSDNLVRLDKSSLSVRPTQDSHSTSYPPTTFIAAQLLELIESTAVRKVIVYSQPSEPAAPAGEHKATTTAETTGPQSRPSSTQEDQPNPLPNTDLNQEPPTENRKTPSLTQHAPEPTEPQPLLLWIFNPDIYYSSSRLTTEGADTPSPETSTHSHPRPETHTRPEPTADSSSNSNTLLPRRALKIFYQRLHASDLESYLSTTSNATYEPLELPAFGLGCLGSALRTSTAMLPGGARAFQEWRVGLLDRYERASTAMKVMQMNPLARGLREGPMGVAVDGRPRVTRWELPLGAGGLFE